MSWNLRKYAVFGVSVLAIAAALSTVGTVVEATGDEFDLTKEESLLGSVKSVSEDGDRVELKTKRGVLLVSGLLQVTRFTHEAKKLEELEDGAKVYVLGQKREGNDTPLNGYPPSIAAVTAIVTGPFTPPKITPKQRKAKLEWVEGELDHKDGATLVGKYQLSTGGNRTVLVVSRSKELKFEKKQVLWVDGKSAPLPDDEATQRSKLKGHVRAERVALTHKKFPAADYAAILGL
ncbi:MAG: hypothetical protein KDC38_21330 [Planctomycetes bacterium]|nr:hypothetical protein [Planctomycetota bacterium]